VQNIPVAFDLEKGDWVAPYGKGIQPDLLIRYSNTNTGPGFLDFSRQLEITFGRTNDGILVLPIDGSSSLRSLYEAPESGYSPSLLIQCDRTTYKVMKRVDLDENHYAIFRVRSATNDNGQLVSANYGKIYGPIQYGILGGQHIRIESYYFNPMARGIWSSIPRATCSKTCPRWNKFPPRKLALPVKFCWHSGAEAVTSTA